MLSIRCFTRWIHTTPPACVLVIAGRRKIDPEQMRMREERTRRKTTVIIRELKRQEKRLKPIDEAVITDRLKHILPERVRPHVALSEEEIDRRALLVKAWSKYRSDAHTAEERCLQGRLAAQTSALAKLRMINPDLYNAAIELDMSLLSFDSSGPTFTPPIKDYHTPDGDYVETTRSWD